MVLNAPGVVSKNVCERDVKAPAPIRIGGSGSGFGSSGGGGRGAIGRGGKQRVRGMAAGGGAGFGTGPGGSIGGFPEVRHRSEMGLVKLGGVTAACVSTSASGSASKVTAVDNRAGGGGRQASGIPSDIHQENLSRVSAMSPEEIAEAQQEIRAALPPGALEMLMRRGRGQKGGGKRPAAETTTKPAATTEHPAGAAATALPAAATAAARANPAADSTTTVDASAAAAAAVGYDGGGAVHKTTSGAPTGAQRLATAVGGVDSEEALEAALLTLPPEERAKSSWTLNDGDAAVTAVAGATGGAGGGGARQGGRGEARVDLDGAVVAATGAGAEGRGALHHHGEEPDKAGYTPSELVRLARWVGDPTTTGVIQTRLRLCLFVFLLCVFRVFLPGGEGGRRRRRGSKARRRESRFSRVAALGCCASGLLGLCLLLTLAPAGWVHASALV